MQDLYLMKTITKWTSVLIILFIAGCAVKQDSYKANQPTLSAATYLQLAASSEGLPKQRYLLQAAKRFVYIHKASQAQSVLNQMNTQDLTPELSNERQLIQANILIEKKIFANAITTLQNLAEQVKLTQDQTLTLHQLLAKAYAKQGNTIASINENNQVWSMLSNAQQKQATAQDIWNQVDALNTTSLNQLAAQTTAPSLRAWFNLALIDKTYSNNTQQLMQQLVAWKKQFPRHPANMLLPTRLDQLATYDTDKPKQVALLLPLQGPLGKRGQAIRNGFFTAYYVEKQDNKFAPQIRVYDTYQKDIRAVYASAVKEGAQFIVGPLTKENVASLSSMRLVVPTLALNFLPNTRGNAEYNLYQFGLSPLDEAIQTANKMREDQHHNVLIITPRNTWAENVANAFSKRWQQLGGDVVATMFYADQSTLSEDISKLLNTYNSQQRYLALHNIVNKKLRFIARRREDIDAVFMVASASLARQIKPMLRFYYAGVIPVYATSQIYAGVPNPHNDHDLDGVLFGDMPWVLSARNEPLVITQIQREVRSLWQNSYQQYPKLYALGVDAYMLLPRIKKMQLLPAFGVRAATGTLYLEPDQHVYRKLEWSTIRDGAPRALND